MGERLVATSRRAVRRGLVLAPGIAIASIVAAATGWSGWLPAIFITVLAGLTVVGLVVSLRRPRPSLRLSLEGIEGAFGLIGWDAVTGVRIRKRLGIWPNGVVVSLNPRGDLFDSTREFDSVEAIELRRDRLVVSTGGLDISADELARTVERYLVGAGFAEAVSPAR